MLKNILKWLAMVIVAGIAALAGYHYNEPPATAPAPAGDFFDGNTYAVGPEADSVVGFWRFTGGDMYMTDTPAGRYVLAGPYSHTADSLYLVFSGEPVGFLITPFPGGYKLEDTAGADNTNIWYLTKQKAN